MGDDNSIEGMIARLNKDRSLKTAYQFTGNKSVIRVTRRNKFSKRNTRHEFIVTIGKANAVESRLEKQLIKAGSIYLGCVLVKCYPVKRVKK